MSWTVDQGEQIACSGQYFNQFDLLQINLMTGALKDGSRRVKSSIPYTSPLSPAPSPPFPSHTSPLPIPLNSNSPILLGFIGLVLRSEKYCGKNQKSKKKLFQLFV